MRTVRKASGSLVISTSRLREEFVSELTFGQRYYEGDFIVFRIIIIHLYGMINNNSKNRYYNIQHMTKIFFFKKFLKIDLFKDRRGREPLNDNYLIKQVACHELMAINPLLRSNYLGVIDVRPLDSSACLATIDTVRWADLVNCKQAWPNQTWRNNFTNIWIKFPKAATQWNDGHLLELSINMMQIDRFFIPSNYPSFFFPLSFFFFINYSLGERKALYLWDYSWKGRSIFRTRSMAYRSTLLSWKSSIPRIDTLHAYIDVPFYWSTTSTFTNRPYLPQETVHVLGQTLKFNQPRVPQVLIQMVQFKRSWIHFKQKLLKK